MGRERPDLVGVERLPVGVARFTPAGGGAVEVFETFERRADGSRMKLWHNGGKAMKRLKKFGSSVRVVGHGFRSYRQRGMK